MRSRWLLALASLAACAPPPGAAAPPGPPAPASASAPAEAPPPSTSVRLPGGVTPSAYTLELRVDPRQERFEGVATVRVALEKPSRYVVMHGRDLTISRATATAQDGRLPAAWSSRRARGGREADEEIVLSFDRELPAGEVTLEIAYSAPFAGLRGLYRVQVGEAWYAFTQLEAVDARRMFPGFDEPRFKTPFSLRVSAPRGMKVFANAALAREEPDGERVRHVFEPTPPLPTYLVALAVGDLDVFEGPRAPTPVRLIATKGKAGLGKTSAQAAAELLKIFGDYFDRPYPYGKLDLVAVPNFGPGAMENPGLVTFREELLLVDGDASSLPMKRRMALVTAHELAHQWFGDLVTMAWWDDLWLNEGFATWMAAKTCDRWQPGFGGMLELTAGKLNVMNADMLPSARPVRVPVETSNAILESGGWTAYQKGGSLLAMLERWVGEAPFRDGIRAYIKAHEHGTVTSDDLLRALDASTGKPVSRVARSFLEQPGVPVVSFARQGAPAGKGPGVALRLTQSPLRALVDPRGDSARVWSIPVCVGSSPCVLLEGDGAELVVPDGPFYPNASEDGYFRFDTGNLTPATGKGLGEAERLGLLSNAWALTQAGRMDASKFFDTVERASLGEETSRVVVEQAVAMLHGARDALVDARHEAAFRAAATRWLSPQAGRLGWRSRPGEPDDTRLLRLAVLSALWDLAEDPGVAREAEALAKAYLKDPTSVDRDLGPLALRVSSQAGGAASAEALRQRLAAALPFDRTVLIGALASSRDEKTLRATFELTLSGEIRSGDFRYLWGAVGRRPDLRAAFSSWLRERFSALQSKLGNAGGFAWSIAWQCDREGQARAVDFYEPRLATVEGMQRPYDEALAQSRLCVQVRGREAERAGRWLDAHR